MFLFAFSLFACTPELESTVDTQAPVAEEIDLITWESCSQTIDDHPCDFSLSNSEGDIVSLYDFIENPVVLDLSAMWCAPCNRAADEVQAVQDHYSDFDLVYLTVLIENYDGEPPTVEDLELWKSEHVIETAPVLAGSRDLLSANPDVGWPLTGWPTFYFIDDEMVLRSEVRGFNAMLIDVNILDIL